MNTSLPADARISHYRIVSQLGAGGMGEVYLAEDRTLDRRVALKLLPADVAADPERKRRLLREAKAASALSHPNICVIHEVGEAENGDPFIVMEYVEGQTLQDKVRGRPIEVGELVRIALQTADALEAAHARGITHRDLKPANLMITPRGQVKVLDFGLAKMATSTPQGAETATALQTDPAVVLGTVQYMSPEQALGRDVDHRSDLFSFGIVLYELATGRLPFTGPTATETIERITHGQPDAIARFNYSLPPELDRIVRKCLEKDRERRYQSARELAVDLKNLQRDSDAATRVSGGSASAPSRPLRSAILVGAAVLVLTASAGVYWLVDRSREPAIDSIAVLPFTNANGDPNLDILADGIPESIINILSQLPTIKVISRTSAFTFKGREVNTQEVGQKLGARAIVNGRIAQRAENLIISIEMVDARDSRQIWGQQYNRKLADWFAVQEQMANEIADKLRVKLSVADRQQLAKRPTENLKAFELHQKGRDFVQRRTKEDLLMAIDFCEQALQQDKNYALAHACLSDAYLNLGIRGYIPPIEGRHKAEDAARKAVELDENLAEAHVARANVETAFAPFNFAEGDAELLRAIQLKPSSAWAYSTLAFSLVRQGRLDDALIAFSKARELDRLSSIIARGLSVPYYLKRMNTRALELLREANEFGPGFTAPWEAGIYIANGAFDEAFAGLEEERRKRGRQKDPLVIYSTGMIYAAQGKRAQALQIITELEAMSGTHLDQALWIAKVYAALKDKDQAFDWLYRGLPAGAIGIFYKDEPVWDVLRSDPRFAQLLRQMHAPL